MRSLRQRLPGLQAPQALRDVAPVASLYVPAGHSSHALAAASEENVPAGHTIQLVPPGGLKLPTGHGTQDCWGLSAYPGEQRVVQAVEDVAPGERVTVSCGQSMHALLEFAPSAALQLPSGHSWHADTLSAPWSSENVPAGQRTQALKP